MPAVSVFLSYARKDDEATYGRITKLKTDIQTAYEALSGDSVGVFQDTESISLGERWRDRIRAGLTSSSIMLAFISPAYLRSTACREELREFIAFLDAESNRRLIIPLIYGDLERLTRDFGENSTWQEISKLQFLPIPDLRKADPGSFLWLENVEKIATRIDQELAAAAARPALDDPIAPLAEATSDEPQFAGTMEIFAEFETAAPSFTSHLEEFTEVFNRLNMVFDKESPKLQAAETFTDKLAITKRVATLMTPISDDAMRLSQSLSVEIAAFDTAVREATRLVRSGVEPADDPETLAGLDAIRGLATIGIESLSYVDEFKEAIEGILGSSASLDRPLRKLKESLLTFAEMRGIFRGWLDELDSL